MPRVKFQNSEYCCDKNYSIKPVWFLNITEVEGSEIPNSFAALTLK